MTGRAEETILKEMTTDTIRIRGARENNLKDISLDIPKYKITVFTGVSDWRR